jgi:hypothetical protein
MRQEGEDLFPYFFTQGRKREDRKMEVVALRLGTGNWEIELKILIRT